MKNKKQLSEDQANALMETLKSRFKKNKALHEGLDWNNIQAKLEANPEKLWVLDEMEVTGGEPDVVGYDKKSDEFIFFDCSPETPKDRRSICYDRAAWESRKANRPENTAMDMAAEMGVELLTEEEYQQLQALGKFDLKTSSWLKTPPEVRKLGGAIFGDRRFDRVFIYHNGADSYYAARGFRGSLRV
ncbi:DUF4256 domain-containing protein [Dyadobacter sp. CY347]|uniref:DUF4256 domain-containing protein n=1 Tax=Dyadobacter sp. CY347 TaxID=2909336 RepID=UPI001F16A318|nr:DUF4256 domain-containing protein [Dyadobacter sp. CY347]MCF2490828.1 DUF4256 domain-containing protein [Dyadobacter sp. CY347]